MHDIDTANLTAALNALPNIYPGPGGVAGVVKDGKVIAKRAWGHTNRDTRQPMTTATRLPICSITKQFTCGVLLATIGEPDRLDSRVAEYLPNFTDPLPRVRDLCHNQSGLRDYWALTVLHGAFAEQTFARRDALPLLARMKTGHFAPGTRYSYCNANFRILMELIESETGRPLLELYKELIWNPAGMKTAVLTADTRHPEDGVVGYEGNDAVGFMPADNGIFWIGDAGISASLEDMLAYEAWIDATRDDPEGLYNRLSAPATFRDGTPASYGFGLGHKTIGGVRTTGHGGALRGFRAHRLHAADERLSVIVHFNHEGDAHAAAAQLLKAALGLSDPPAAPMNDGWDGQWMCPKTGLFTRIEADRDAATLRFATTSETLAPASENALGLDSVTITRAGGALTMTRKLDNLVTTLEPIEPTGHADTDEIAGRYTCDELETAMIIEARDGGVYAVFEGLLGTGRAERVHPAAKDIWLVATRRSMDASAPGDWTLALTRDAEGHVSGATLGCWLARGLSYAKRE